LEIRSELVKGTKPCQARQTNALILEYIKAPLLGCTVLSLTLVEQDGSSSVLGF